MNAVSREEIAASVIQPHFDAVRDAFLEFVPERGLSLSKLERVKFLIDPKFHDKPRHFAATRDDGLLMWFAPEVIDKPVVTLIAIISHEFGHAADFAYPARWYSPASDGPTESIWVPESDIDTKPWRQWSKIWATRDRDQVEWAADAIAKAVLGKEIRYAGDCLTQTFSHGIERPRGLR